VGGPLFLACKSGPCSLCFPFVTYLEGKVAEVASMADALQKALDVEATEHLAL
jgi:hypothetical protein